MVEGGEGKGVVLEGMDGGRLGGGRCEVEMHKCKFDV